MATTNDSVMSFLMFRVVKALVGKYYIGSVRKSYDMHGQSFQGYSENLPKMVPQNNRRACHPTLMKSHAFDSEEQ